MGRKSNAQKAAEAAEAAEVQHLKDAAKANGAIKTVISHGESCGCWECVQAGIDLKNLPDTAVKTGGKWLGIW